jgi:hypothetical protein
MSSFCTLDEYFDWICRSDLGTLCKLYKYDNYFIANNCLYIIYDYKCSNVWYLQWVCFVAFTFFCMCGIEMAMLKLLILLM